MEIKHLLAFLLFVSYSILLIADGPVYRDTVIKSSLLSVQMHPKGLSLVLPVYQLHSSNPLVFSMDDLNNEHTSYSYEVFLCDYNWQQTELYPFDYIEGFETDEINNFESSFNTNQAYTHYSLKLPNENLQFKKSGNYVLKIFETGEEDYPVVIKRFWVVEQIVNISGNVVQPAIVDYSLTHQEVDFTIELGNFDVRNPFEEINVIVMQNARSDNAKTDLKPHFVRNQELVYDYREKNLFPGGKEYREFDTRNLRMQSKRIKQIVSINDTETVFIAADQPRSFLQYHYWTDLNGEFVTDAAYSNDSSLEGDYTNVLFTLPFKAVLPSGHLFVYGALSNWETDTDNQMKYNYERQSYECSLYLKQGYYNYVYAFVPENETIADMELIEGNSFETENNYTIFVYQRTFGAKYDKLIGVKTLNSLHK